MIVFNGTLIQFFLTVKSIQLMVLLNTNRVRSQDIDVTFIIIVQGKGLNNNNVLYNKIDPDLNAMHVALYIKLMIVLLDLQFVSSVTKWVTFPISVILLEYNQLLCDLQLDTGMDVVEATIEAEAETNQDIIFMKLKHRISQSP